MGEFITLSLPLTNIKLIIMDKATFRKDVINLINSASETQEVKDKMIKSIRIRKGRLKREFDAWIWTQFSGRVPIKSTDLYDETLIFRNEFLLGMIDLHVAE